MTRDVPVNVSMDELVQEWIYQNPHKGLHWENVEGYSVHEGPDGVYVQIVFDD